MSQPCIERDNQIHLANDTFELTFDRATGRWIGLRDLRSDTQILDQGGRQASFFMTLDGVTTATRGRAQVDSIVDADTVGTKTVCSGYKCHKSSEGVMLTLHTHEGNWRIDQHYALSDKAATIARGVRIEYQGDRATMLRDVTLRIPPAGLGPQDQCTVEAPGYPTKTAVPLSALPLGEDWDRTQGKPFDIGWEPCVAGVCNEAERKNLLVWCHDEAEPVVLRIQRADPGVSIRHTVMLADRFTSGHTVEWWGQHLQVTHEPWLNALARLQHWYRSIELEAPRPPEWAVSPHIYEVFIGEQPIGDVGVRRSPYANLDDLAHDLPRILDLGFDVIQLMPNMPFPSYAVHDYYDVDVQYGSSAGLKRLVERAHGLGMRVLLDVVVHGVIDRDAIASMNSSMGHGWADDGRLFQSHPYRRKHPEWFVETEFDTPAATYTWAFDHANKEWQDFIIAVLCHYVQAFNVDGFRVDALTWNLFPNWAHGLPHRASASIYGSREMSERLRSALAQMDSETVLYTETTVPVFARAYDWVYNYDMQWIFSALVTPISERGFAYTFAHPTERVCAADLPPWLEQRRLVLPPGVRTVHHLDSHDSHEWGQLMQYRREAFGPEAARALFAFCCSLEGGIMAFAGAELGDEDYYRHLLHLRRTNPALREGSSQYDAVWSDDRRVFTFVRATASQIVVPVILFACDSASVEIRFSKAALPYPATAVRVRDLVQDSWLPLADPGAGPGSDHLTLTLTLAPYQVALLELVPE